MAETSTSTSTPSPSHEMKTYKGSCHCGTIAFSLTLPEIKRFCPVCGTGVMGKRHNAEPGMDIGINARTLEDVDVWKLKVRKVDGTSYEPKWIPHKFIGPEPTAEIEDARMYYGSCHCGATTIALKNKGGIDPSTEMVECNCTIYYKRSLRHIYPLTTQLSIVTNPSHPLTSYIFGRKMMKHMFCSNCGI
ncbi:hypothetical protein HYALB_00007551 [Hymenoscyphus albidus]|uniref:CENP-V/GFA domain-containing protein n=1 Tax=Hymenoscyphus albidus TaxID=595503 RepID=A0A9N9LIX0_9HELO|nr:hypothetical protein HYALB_00007551 [Hymenoscyphus albidus]